MKALTAALIVFAVVLFFMYMNSQALSAGSKVGGISYFDPVDPTIIQNTINQIQEKNHTLYPVTTVYFNKENAGGYSGRLIFMDSKNYKGVQYDVAVDSSGTLTSLSTGVPASFQNPFSGIVSKFKFGTLNLVAPTPDMGAIWSKYAVVA